MSASVGSAPGRLDLLGGVADYSGALVLEVATAVRTTVTAEPTDGLLAVGEVSLPVGEVARIAALPYAEVRAELAAAPRWARYPLGVALVLVRHRVIDAPAVRLSITSEVPVSMGVSSSAALEVATARALGARAEPLRLAALCQEAENQVVGAPCGIMDQVAVALGVPGDVLPILCRPASVEAPVAMPPGVDVVGWPSGAAHDVAGDPYAVARTACFMGKRMVEEATGAAFDWVSDLPRDEVRKLPEAVEGGRYLDRYADVGDPLSSVDAGAVYPVAAATGFGVEEHRRTRAALDGLRRGDVRGLAPLLAASHAGYAAMGLGHPTTDDIVERVLALPGVHGARTSGGGSGGTVVVVCDAGALDGEDAELVR